MTAFISLFKRHLEQETQGRNLLSPRIEVCIIISASASSGSLSPCSADESKDEEAYLEAQAEKDLFNPADLLSIRQTLLDHQSDAAVAVMHVDSVERSGENLGGGWVGALP